FPVNGDITVGGAVATKSHGTSFLVENITDLVTEMTVVDWTGKSKVVRETSEISKWGTSHGRLGVIYSVTFKTRGLPGLESNNLELPLEVFLNYLNRLMDCDRLQAVWNLKD